MNVTLYKPPHGRKEVIDVRNVYPDDEAWFAEHKAAISMEEIGGMFAIYAHVGGFDEDGEPVEAIEISRHRSCEDTLASLRQQCEELLKEHSA